MADTKEFMTIPEVAKYLGLSQGRVRELVVRMDRPIPTADIGGERILVPRRALDKWIDDNTSYGRTA